MRMRRFRFRFLRFNGISVALRLCVPPSSPAVIPVLLCDRLFLSKKGEFSCTPDPLVLTYFTVLSTHPTKLNQRYEEN